MQLLNLLSDQSPEELYETQKIFRNFLRQSTLDLLCHVMAEEVTLLCGPKHFPSSSSGCQRGGSASGFVRIDGHENSIQKPRVRQKKSDGKTQEVGLLSYRLAQDSEALKEQLIAALQGGVSCRDAASVTKHSGQRSTSKSEVSRLWKKEGQKFLEKFRSQDFSQKEWAVLMLDGISLGKDLFAVVALGINLDGQKQILDFEIGASENEAVATELTERLYSRGFRGSKNGRLFCVLDGSKSLRKAVIKVFPKSLIQRCLVHKQRNIKRLVSKKLWGKVDDFMDELRKSINLKEAKSVVKRFRLFLSRHSLKAVESLDEGGDDLLRFWEVEAPHELKSTLLSTNVIENSFKNTRRKIDRVDRWRGETDQASRWLAYALEIAEKGFRRVRGFQKMRSLAARLEKVDEEKKRRVF